MKQIDETYKSISVTKDGYVQNPGVGYMLSTYFYSPKTVQQLIHLGNINGLKSVIDGDTLGPQLKVMSSTEELVDYCIDKAVDYLYVFEDKKWKWIHIFGITDINSSDERKLNPLNTSDVIEHIDKELIDVPTYCSYRTAAMWGGANIVLLNNIKEIDEDFYPEESFYDENENENEDEYPPEIFQYYITDLSDDDVEWRKTTFPDLTYHYSNVVDKWILCVTHYGTSWDYVSTQYIGMLSIKKEEFDRFNKKN